MKLIDTYVDLRIEQEKKYLHKRIEQLGHSMFLHFDVRLFHDFAHKFRIQLEPLKRSWCDIYQRLITVSDYHDALSKILGVQQTYNDNETFTITCFKYEHAILREELINDVKELIEINKLIGINATLTIYQNHEDETKFIIVLHLYR